MGKRCATLILVLILAVGSAYAGEWRLDVKVIVGEKEPATACSFLLTETAENSVLQSSLLPDIGFALKDDSEHHCLERSSWSQLFSEADGIFNQKTESILQFLAPYQTRDVLQGTFTGDIFDRAASMQEYIIPSDTLQKIQSEIYSFSEKNKSSIIPEDMSLVIRCYDRMFWTVNILEEERIVMTASFNVDENDAHFLFGHAEKDTDYYLELQITKEQTHISGSSCLKKDPYGGGWRTLQENDTILRSSWDLAWMEEAEKSELTIRYDLFPERTGMEAFKINGTVQKKQNREEIVLLGGFGNRRSSIILSGTVEFTEQSGSLKLPSEIIELDRITESEMETIGLKAGTEAWRMLGMILIQWYPYLPGEWKTILPFDI